MSYEQDYTAKLESIILAMGGVVPMVSTPTNFQARSLALLDAMASASAGARSSYPLRQTALTGPVDANGRADFLQAAAGLQVVTKTLSPTLLLSFGDGLNVRGAVDSIAETAIAIAWPNLPASSTSYLYVDLSGSTLTPGSTTLAPAYNQFRPIAPTTGLYWYPTDHRSRGEVWNGSSWVPVLRLFLGQVTTNGVAPTDIRSYAYQGKTILSGPFAINNAYNFNHNVGTALLEWYGFFNSISGTFDATNYPNGTGGYPIGQNLYNGSLFYGTDARLDMNAIRLRTGDTGIWYGASGGSAFTGAFAQIFVERSF